MTRDRFGSWVILIATKFIHLASTSMKNKVWASRFQDRFKHMEENLNKRHSIK